MAFYLVTGHSSLFSYDLVSQSGNKSRLAYVDTTLTYFKGVVNHYTTLTRAYSSALIYYLVLLELDHVDHGTTTTFVKIEVAKVDLTAGEQRTWPYQHIQQPFQLSPTWWGNLIELIFLNQALNPL